MLDLDFGRQRHVMDQRRWAVRANFGEQLDWSFAGLFVMGRSRISVGRKPCGWGSAAANLARGACICVSQQWRLARSAAMSVLRPATPQIEAS